MTEQKELIERLRDSAGKAQFVSFTYRNKKANELARHTLIIGASYKAQIQSSLWALKLLQPSLVSELQKLACDELIQSFEDSLKAIETQTPHPKNTKPDAYVTIAPGLKYCLSTGKINVFGLAHKKVVLEPGVYPKVNSKPLTIAKNELKEQLPIARWREFVLAPENLQVARLQGVELELN